MISSDGISNKARVFQGARNENCQKKKKSNDEKGQTPHSRFSGAEEFGGKSAISVGDDVSLVRARFHLEKEHEGLIQRRCENIRDFADNRL